MSFLLSTVAKLVFFLSLLFFSTFASPLKGLDPRLKWTLKSTCIGMMEDGVHRYVKNKEYNFGKYLGVGTYTGCIKLGIPDGPGAVDYNFGIKFIGNFLNGKAREGYTTRLGKTGLTEVVTRFNDKDMVPKSKLQNRHQWYH